MISSQRYVGLRLAVFQVRPVTWGTAQDGAQAILMDLLNHFGGIGVSVTVYCGRRLGLAAQYQLYPGVEVRAVLPFNEADPDPYRAAPFHLADIIDVMRRAAADHDVLYIHDSNLRFQIANAEVPTVSAVFDLIYGHTVAGALNFDRDRLVAISNYVGSCLREIFGRFRPLSQDSLHVVATGFDTRRFRRCDPASIRARLGIAATAIAVLCPHRPDPAKGGFDALSGIASLRTRLPAADFARVRMLIPDWRAGPDDTDPSATRFYDELVARATDLGVKDKLVLHEWIPRSEMPNYYSLGAATLCVGTFPEALGNVHIESMLCGTPSVVSRVAAQRTTLPEDHVRKVDPGRPEAIADHLAEMIERRERVTEATSVFLRSRFSSQRMLRGYEQAILECIRGPAIPAGTLPGPQTDRTVLSLPPWSARLTSGYYHDYTGYCTDRRLLDCVDRIETTATTSVGDLTAAGLATPDELRDWLRDGYLVSRPAVAAEWSEDRPSVG